MSGRQGHMNAKIKRIFLMPAVLYLLVLSDLSPLLVTQHQLHRLSAGHLRLSGAAGEASRQPTGILGSGINLTLRNYARMLRDGRLHTAAINT